MDDRLFEIARKHVNPQWLVPCVEAMKEAIQIEREQCAATCDERANMGRVEAAFCARDIRDRARKMP